MTEHELQNNIRLALGRRGMIFRHNVGLFKTTDGRTISSGLPPGFSDLQYIGDGGVVAFIEVKTPTGRLSTAQRDFLNAVRRYGVRAGIARSVEDAIKIIEGDIETWPLD